MRRPSQKIRERNLLEAFLRKEGIQASVQPHEAPDFLLTLASGTVGVEVTELHHPSSDPSSSLQAREAIAERIIQKAQSLHHDRGGPSLRVSVNLNLNVDHRAIHRDSAAEQLCKLVNTLLERSGDILEWRPEAEDFRFAQPTFSYVHVYRQPPDFRPHWLYAAAGWVAPLTHQLVQRVVEDKAALLPKYRQHCQTIWLLISIPGTKPSQFFDMELQFDPSTIKSPFDRTILVESFLERAIDLGPRDDA